MPRPAQCDQVLLRANRLELQQGRMRVRVRVRLPLPLPLPLLDMTRTQPLQRVLARRRDLPRRRMVSVTVTMEMLVATEDRGCQRRVSCCSSLVGVTQRTTLC